MSTESTTKKEQMIEALKNSLGVVSHACEVVGISRNTHYTWMREDADYKEQCEAITESAIDFVESKLFERISGVLIGKKDKDGGIDTYELPPDNTSIIFYLKTKGKKRGYVERQEVISNTVERFIDWGISETDSTGEPTQGATGSNNEP